MSYCNSTINPISRRTLNRDMQSLFLELKPTIISCLEDYTDNGGCINITLNACTSRNKVPYLGIIAYWMNQNHELQNIIIRFKRLRGSHTAENRSQTTYNVFREYKIHDFIKCITAHNVTVNTAMLNIFEFDLMQGVGWSREDGHVHCMGHVINLAAQMVLQVLKAEAAIPEVTLAEQKAGIAETSAVGTFRMVRKIASKIRTSNLIWEALEAQCLAVKIEHN
jgi:hypothetical protein